MDDIEPLPPDTEVARTTNPRVGRRSARSQRIEVITRAEGRRVWELDQKREIALTSLQPGVRPSDVARLHGVSTGQLYTWRRQMLEGQLGAALRRAPSFARVEIAAAPSEAAHEVVVRSGTDGEAPAALACRPEELWRGRGGLMEIGLPGGVYVRVDAQVQGPALRLVLSALERR
jgi:transposase